jgi:pyruvate dehydrogenase E2 component (dihydrolipoamide acetyltransferase)
VARVGLEIPKVGLVMENARLVRWLKHVGETVQQGEPLLELETEKSVVEIEASESGRLAQILVNAEQLVQVGDRVAWLETDAPEAAGSPSSGASSASAAPNTSTASSVPAASSASAVSSGPDKFAASATPDASVGKTARPAHPASRPTLAAVPMNGGRIRSSPAARRLAAENALDLRALSGTGPRGRIQLKDVREALGSSPAQTDPGRKPQGPQPLSAMRRALARSMSLSNATVPQFSVGRSVDFTVLNQHRARIIAGLPAGSVRPSVNDFLLQAIARTLLAFPALNATFTGDVDSPEAAITPAIGAHIGLVVATESGLLVPVLHGVERMGLAELARRRSECVERALQGKLKRDELQGATLSLSNLGARGPDRFTAMINPPESAILAVGRQRDCVVALNGGLHIRPMCELSLTVDHRVADGRLAADFLSNLCEILQGDIWRV